MGGHPNKPFNQYPNNGLRGILTLLVVTTTLGGFLWLIKYWMKKKL